MVIVISSALFLGIECFHAHLVLISLRGRARHPSVWLTSQSWIKLPGLSAGSLFLSLLSRKPGFSPAIGFLLGFS